MQNQTNHIQLLTTKKHKRGLFVSLHSYSFEGLESLYCIKGIRGQIIGLKRDKNKKDKLIRLVFENQEFGFTEKEIQEFTEICNKIAKHREMINSKSTETSVKKGVHGRR